MTFKEFIRLTEEGPTGGGGGGGGDNGLMGYPVASSVRKPSDGQPFKQFLGSVSGQTPRGAGGGAPPPGGAPMMRKKMKRK